VEQQSGCGIGREYQSASYECAFGDAVGAVVITMFAGGDGFAKSDNGVGQFSGIAKLAVEEPAQNEGHYILEEIH
jgi:hypothetical protein